MVSKPSCEQRWKDVPIFKKRRMEPTFCLLSLSLFLGGEDQMEQKIAKNFLRSFKIWGNWVFFAWLHRHYLDPRNARLGTTTSTITTTTSTTILKGGSIVHLIVSSFVTCMNLLAPQRIHWRLFVVGRTIRLLLLFP